MANWKKYSSSSEEQEVSPEQVNTTTERGNSGTITWILGALIAVAAILAIYFGIRSNSYQNRSTNLEAQLEDTKTSLQDELTTVQVAYDTQLVVNEGLSAEIEKKVEEVEDLQTKISQARNQLALSKANSDEIKARLDQMEILKTELEADLVTLQEVNDSLVETTTGLTLALDESKVKVEQMSTEIANLTEQNQELDRRLTKLAPAGFRADNFRITVERRNDKLTSRARRADEIVVEFDLNNVPAEKQGSREIYLAVTALNGNPVTVFPVQEVSVPAANEPLQVNAADIEKVNLEETQSVAMSFKPNRDLNAGEYNVFIYSDAGYLGATGFRLR